MQGTALWKRILILIICGWGIAAAVPNLFYAQVERHNDAAADIELAGGTATAEQSAALAEWPSVLPSALMNLGLDLRGGAHPLDVSRRKPHPSDRLRRRRTGRQVRSTRQVRLHLRLRRLCRHRCALPEGGPASGLR